MLFVAGLLAVLATLAVGIFLMMLAFKAIDFLVEIDRRAWWSEPLSYALAIPTAIGSLFGTIIFAFAVFVKITRTH